MTIITDAADLCSRLTQKKVLVFDFDGVLADSVNVKTEAYGAMYLPMGDAIAAQVIDYHVSNGGVSRFDKFSYWEKLFFGREITNDRMVTLCQQFSSLVVDKVVDAHAVCGANDFLGKVKALGLTCVVNSATPDGEIKEIVQKRGINDYFSDVLGSPNSKSDNLKIIINNGGYHPDELLFFGDAQADLDAAQIIPVDFVGVGAEIVPIMSSRCGSFYAIDDFTALLSILNCT